MTTDTMVGTAPAGSADQTASGATTQRRRILHLCTPAPFGGLEQVVASLAREQVRAGHAVHVGAVLGMDVVEPPFIERVRAGGVPVTVLRLPHRAYVQEARAVRALCDDVRPDIVHTHGYHADVVHGWAARRAGMATVSTAHGFIRGDWKNRLFERLQLWTHRRTAAVVAVSRPMASALTSAGVPVERVHVVRNAWAADPEFLDRGAARRALGVPEQGFRAGFVGRLGYEKAPDLFVRAVSEAGAPAVVIGDGRLREDMERLAEELGVAGSIRWTGRLAEPRRLMRGFDVIVLSSRTEGTPIVLLEAMAAGVPVIATRVGGVPDVVSSNEALLVPPEDPAALADAIRTVREGPDAALARAARARARLESVFGPKKWVDAYDEVYRSCMTLSS